jgi:hypothetical protein
MNPQLAGAEGTAGAQQTSAGRRWAARRATRKEIGRRLCAVICSHHRSGLLAADMVNRGEEGAPVVRLAAGVERTLRRRRLRPHHSDPQHNTWVGVDPAQNVLAGGRRMRNQTFLRAQVQAGAPPAVTSL